VQTRSAAQITKYKLNIAPIRGNIDTIIISC